MMRFQSKNPGSADPALVSPQRDEVGSVQNDTVGKHRHMVYSTGCKDGEKDYGFDPRGKGGSKPGSFHSRHTAPFGGNETRPKNIYVNWIIKAKHIIQTQQ